MLTMSKSKLSASLAAVLVAAAVAAAVGSQVQVDLMASAMVGVIDATPVVPEDQTFSQTRPQWASFLELNRPDGNEHECKGGACAWGGTKCCAGGAVCCPPGFACQVGNPPRCGPTAQEIAVKVAKRKAFEEGDKQKEKMAEQEQKEEEKAKAHAKKVAEHLEKQQLEQKKKAEELKKQQEKAKNEAEKKTAEQKAEEAKKDAARKEEEDNKKDEEAKKKEAEKVRVEQHEKRVQDGKAKKKQEELQKKLNEEKEKAQAKADAIRKEHSAKAHERNHKHEIHHKHHMAVLRRRQAEQRLKAANRVQFLRGWRNYGHYRSVEAKRWGPFCILSGLARRGAYRGPILRLPKWCRPRYQTLHALFGAGGLTQRFDVTRSGLLYWITGRGNTPWLTVDGVMLPIVSAGHNAHTARGLYLHPHYRNYGGGHELATWTKYGDYCQLSGLIRTKGGHIVHHRYVARVPPTCYPHGRLIFDAQHNTDTIRLDLLSNGWLVVSNIASHSVPWLSLNNVGYFVHRGHNLHQMYGWHPYGHTYRAPAVHVQGHFCQVTGLLRGNRWGNHFGRLPGNCRPHRRLIFWCNNHAGRYRAVRIDVLPNGIIHRYGGGASHGWVSLNNIKFMVH